MKRFVCAMGLSLLLCAAVQAETASLNRLTAKGYDLVLDAAFLAGSIAFERVQLNENSPAFSSEQKDYIEETIPTWAAVAVTAPVCGLPLLIEGRHGMYHARGFALSYSANAFAHSLVGSLAGRHRPNFDAAQAVGEDAEKTSFYSGHSAISFGTATYASAYLVRYSPAAAIPAAIVLYCGAGYMAYTRYAEHYHNISDLVVGAIAGAGISYGVFRYFESHRPVPTQPEVSLGYAEGSTIVRICWRFR